MTNFGKLEVPEGLEAQIATQDAAPVTIEAVASFSLDSALEHANTAVSDIRAALAKKSTTPITGLGGSALAYLLAGRSEPSSPVVCVTPDSDGAEQLARELSAWAGEQANGPVLLFPAPDTTPYPEVAADRRTAMDRLSVLFHLTQGLAFQALVLPASSLVRRLPPKAAIAARSTTVKVESELDRETFLRLLNDGGYLRAPLAEDPGTFAVRGNLIDVFPPHADVPCRIELDDWLVLSIKRFDPDTQRTLEATDQVLIHPVRDTVRTDQDLSDTLRRVRDRCDAANYPSSKTRELLEHIEEGRTFYGADNYLPAFFPELGTLFDYVPDSLSWLLVDRSAVDDAIDEELSRAAEDFAARMEDGLPAFSVESHYLPRADVESEFQSRHLVCASGPPPREDHSLNLAGQDHRDLALALRTQRTRATDDALAPLAHRIFAWQDAGLRVVLTARTEAQASRLRTLLRPSGLKPQTLSQWNAAVAPSLAAGSLSVAICDLGRGLLLPTEGLAVVTEEEIFGARQQRRSKRRARRDAQRAFLEDLRELGVGDYVVHADHGIGRYCGIERKVIGQSQLDRLQGKKPIEVEVLVIEYAKEDRLFLPVTRLSQLQKFSGKEGHAPKLDKLGGQSFAKTKAKVRKRVKQLAEELLKLYAERAAQQRAPLPAPGSEFEAFEATFPFDETPDQRRAIEDVLEDLERSEPMDRVVCGDVGFGKTEVAIRAAFRAAMAGRQVAILCPTTVLAQQHHHTFRERLRDYPIEVRVLSRFVEKAQQTTTIAGLKDGTVDVIIGTHRVLSKDVHFKRLGLLVVDEEQRFGVAHKERIKKLRSEVDVLTLSATPIPRTLQMAIGGLRNLSLITTPPTDRRAVRTFATRWDDHLIREAIRRELARGGQVFFVFNRIEGLHERAARLQELVPEGRLAVAHGQLKPATLERLMTDFVEGQYDVLCSTAIIESGLDIPRANTMIVDRADIFGLSQLYQLRGRVGRSRERAYCYLITPPRSRMSDDARYRIEALERFTALGSGFHVASLDLEQRGAGDILGAEQSGAVAEIGFDLFVHMLQDAVAELRGEPIQQDVDPEMNFDVEWHLPDDYVDDVGLRLSFYKRFAQATDEDEVQDLAQELADRFGPLPSAAEAFVHGMAQKPTLRRYRVLGVDASQHRVTLHLQEDTLLDPAKVMQLIKRESGAWSLTPDLKLSRRYDRNTPPKNGIERLEEILETLKQAEKGPAG